MAQNGTLAYVGELPPCDFCKDFTKAIAGNELAVEVTKAKYDFRTKTGQWANACPSHYRVHRMHRELGVGKGQRLMVHSPELDSDPAGQS